MFCDTIENYHDLTVLFSLKLAVDRTWEKADMVYNRLFQFSAEIVVQWNEGKYSLVFAATFIGTMRSRVRP